MSLGTCEASFWDSPDITEDFLRGRLRHRFSINGSLSQCKTGTKSKCDHNL